jgi:hypothetical protein
MECVSKWCHISQPVVLTSAMNGLTAQMAFENGIRRNHRIKLNYSLSQIKLFYLNILFVFINQMHN